MNTGRPLEIRFGQLTLLREFKNEKGHRMCECKCDCGTVKTFYHSNLKSGRTKSCGCLEEANRRKYRDLSGMRFERLIALSPTEQRQDGRVVWLCRCDCGNKVYVSAAHLLRGFTKSCGCHAAERQDISYRRFGRLIALCKDEASRKSGSKWLCLCDCGTICSVQASNLKNGHTKSCGCLADEEHRTLVDGTCLELVASDTISKNNRSGVKGVSYYSRTDSWVSTLTFQGKRYFLGKYATVTEAAKQRKLAEERIVKPFLLRYRNLLSQKKKEL